MPPRGDGEPLAPGDAPSSQRSPRKWAPLPAWSRWTSPVSARHRSGPHARSWASSAGNTPGFPLPSLDGQPRPALSWPCLSGLVLTAQPLREAVPGFLSFPPSYLFSIGCLPASAPWLHPHGSPSLVHGTCGRASVLGPCSGPQPQPLDPAFPLPAPDAPVPLAHSSPSTEDPPCVHLPHPDWTSSGAPCAHTKPASRSAQPPDSSSFCPCQPPTHPTRQRAPWPGHVWLVLARLLRVFLSGRPAAGGLRLLFTDASAVLRTSARDRAPSEGPVSACGGRRGWKSEPSFCPALFKLLVPQEASEAPRLRPWLP